MSEKEELISYTSNKNNFSDYDGLTPSGKKKVDCWSDKNDKSPNEVSISNGNKFWFSCDKCPHDFEIRISCITKKSHWCSYCSNHKLCNNSICEYCFNKSFANCNGKTPSGNNVIDRWSNKNKKLKPRDFTLQSNKKFWFDCDKCPHEFENSLSAVSGGTWCLYCANQKRCDKEDCQHCYNNSFASYNGKTLSGKNKVDCWSVKNPEKPRDVALNTHTKFCFDCDKCPHDFECALNKINGGGWCPYCSGHIICYNEDCEYCFNKSFANCNGKTPSGNNVIDRWSDKNPQKPRDVSICNDKKIWFDCDKCPHDFECALSHVSNGRWCPYCCIPVKKLCNNSSCEYCFNQSFANCNGKTPLGKKKVDCWSNKNKKLKPRDVALQSNKKFWFDCDKCPHEFESSLNAVSGSRWCLYCANQKRCDKEDCQHCYNNSFASYNGKTPSGKNKVDCWSVKNPQKPRDVALNTHTKFCFDCDKCPHDFECALNTINRGCWCPYCINKTELKLYNWLLQHHNIKEVKKEYAPKWCSTEYTHIIKTKYKIGKYQYRFDFLVTLKNKKQIIIELDGRQHYEQVWDWKTPLEQQVRDKYKEFKAKGKGLDIIRCYQEDVFMDQNEWDIKLECLLKM